jgi:hypothetical protein
MCAYFVQFVYTCILEIDVLNFIPSNVVLSGSFTVPQDWITRIGVGFSFGFKTALEATMAFALLQCLWLSLRRRPFSIKSGCLNDFPHIR